MGERVAGLNPEILAWARIRSGRTVSDVASALGKKPEVVEAWESGSEAPTYAQLERLAYSLYKRPLALFFFPKPPDEPDPEHSFRTLPDFEIAELSPHTRFRIREAQSFQLSLRELTGGTNPAPNLLFRDLKTDPGVPTEGIAAKVRAYIGVSLEVQTAEWKTTEQALKGWRNALEEHGLFIFKAAFRQDDVSGFCLYHDEFPVIYVNNSTPQTRQIFTLFHELAHILLETNGVTKLNDRYIAALSGEERAIEIFCNRFAADLLVPRSALRAATGSPTDDTFISNLAQSFKVSREVILRRYLDDGRVSRDFYEKKAEFWRREAQGRREERTGGGNYYLTQASYLGDNYLRLAFRRYYEGAINFDQLAEHLNVNPKSVGGLEQQLFNRTSG